MARASEERARFVCWKHSWRGKYRRILVVGSDALSTLEVSPEGKETNAWSFVSSSRQLGVESRRDRSGFIQDVKPIGPTAEARCEREDQEIIISARTDEKGKVKSVKFSCRYRAFLLTEVQRAIASLDNRHSVGAHWGNGNSQLGQFKCSFRQEDGTWIAAIVFLTTYGLLCIDSVQNRYLWELNFSCMGNPAFQILEATDACPFIGALAVICAEDVFGAPRAAILAFEDRPKFLNLSISAAQEYIGIKLKISDKSVDGRQLSIDDFEAFRTKSYEKVLEQGNETIVGEWIAVRILGDEDVNPNRKIVLTHKALYERSASTYECISRMPLEYLSCVVRDVMRPQYFTLEFGGPLLLSASEQEKYSSPRSNVFYRCTKRDALLAAIVDTAEFSTGRVFDVAGEETWSSSHVWGLPQAEVEKMQLGSLTHSSKLALDLLVRQRREAHSQSVRTAQNSESTSGEDLQEKASIESNDENLSVQQHALAMDLDKFAHMFFDQVRKFNACIPANGLGVTTRIEDDVVAALVVSLPPSSLPESSHHHSAAGALYLAAPPEASLQIQCMVLDCLYRIVGAVSAHAAFVSSSSGFPRLFQCLLASRTDPDGGGVAASAAKLLSKLVRGHSREAAHRLVGIVSFEKERRAAEAVISPRAARLASLNPPGRLTILFAPFMPEKPVEGILKAPEGPSQEDYPYATDGSSLEEDQLKRNQIMSSLSTSTAIQRSAKFVASPSPLLTMALLDVLYECCAGRSGNSTEPFLKRRMLRATSFCGRSLFSMFDHPAHRAADETAKLMKAMSMVEGNDVEQSTAFALRDSALKEGATLHHLKVSLFGSNRSAGVSQALSRELFALWTDGHRDSLAMLSRIVPSGLLAYLFQGRRVMGDLTEILSQPESTIRDLDWSSFWQAFSKEHLNPELIWNARTQQELKLALESEEQKLKIARQQLEERTRKARGSTESDLISDESIAWNHREFRVQYLAYKEELYVSGVFVRHLVERAQASDEVPCTVKLRSPIKFFHSLLHRVLVIPAQQLSKSNPNISGQKRMLQECQLCVRAMKIVFEAYGQAIGQLGEGTISFFLHRLDFVASNSLRVDLMRLLSCWLCLHDFPLHTREFIDNGGIELCIDMAMMAHVESLDLSEKEADADMDNAAERQWYLVGGQEKSGVSTQAGPFNLRDLCSSLSKGEINWQTLCIAEGMNNPCKMRDIRQLRWLFADLASTKALKDGSLVALQILGVLVKRCSSFDKGHWREAPQLIPPPELVSRIASPLRMGQIASLLLLTQLPAVADSSAKLLRDVLVRSRTDAMGRLYATGAIHFALAYDGADYSCMAELLSISHLTQNCRIEAGTAASGSDEFGGSSIRSILRSALPGSLINLLVKGGPKVFSAALCGESDAPVLVWTRRMRARRLIPAMLQHIGDFAVRIAENHTAKYVYVPVPPIRYPELDGDMWCHRFYLQPLCRVLCESPFALLQGDFTYKEKDGVHQLIDDIRQDADEFLRALLHMWRRELQQPGPVLSFSKAVSIMELDLGPGMPMVTEADLKRAYRKLAMRYHPDKNPAGQEKFLDVQAAFTVLQEHMLAGKTSTADEVTGQEADERVLVVPDAKDSPIRSWRSLLILKSQCLLFQHCSDKLAPFKYGAFHLLLSDIENEMSSKSFVTLLDLANGVIAGADNIAAAVEESSDRLLHCSALCWLTCVSSPKNGDELVRCGGVPVLLNVFSKCAIPALQRSVSAQNEGVGSCGNIELEQKGALVTSITSGGRNQLVPEDIVLAISTFALRTLAGLAALPEQQKQLAGRSSLLQDVIRLCSFSNNENGLEETPLGAALIDAALQFLSALCGCSEGQEALLRAGILAWLVPLLFLYDPSAESLVKERDEVKQSTFFGVGSKGDLALAKNQHAMFATRTLARLAGGYLGASLATPECPKAKAAVIALLTAPIAARLSEINPRSLLKLLASSDVETPVVIWNQCMRKQLLDFLVDQRQQQILQFSDGTQYDMASACSMFAFDSIKNELVVGGVFLRVFNLQSMEAVASTYIVDPPKFADDLLLYIMHAQNASDMMPSPVGKITSESLHAVLQSLHHLLVAMPNVAATFADPKKIGMLALCISYKADFAESNQSGSYFDSIVSSSCTDMALQVLSELSSHRLTAGLVPATSLKTDSQPSPVVRRAFIAALFPPTAQVRLSALHLVKMIASSPEAAWYSAHGGGAVFLLSVILEGACNIVFKNGSTDDLENAESGIIEESCMTALASLCQLMSQEQYGKHVSHVVHQLMPAGMAETIGDGPPDAAWKALLVPSDTPERVWRPIYLKTALHEIEKLTLAARTAEGKVEVPNISATCFLDENDDFMVGGIFIKRFLREPKYPLRDPKKAAEGILEVLCSSAINSAADESASKAVTKRKQLLADAAVALLRHQEKLSEHLVSLGYPSMLLRTLSAIWAREVPPTAQDGSLSTATLLLKVVHQLSYTQSGAEALAASTNPNLLSVIGSIAVQKAHSLSKRSAADLVVGDVFNSALSLEIIQRVIALESRSRDLIVQQALDIKLVEDLLQELEGWHKDQPDPTLGQFSAGQESRNIRVVLAINVLHLMVADGAYSARVEMVLASSPVWKHYQEQKHDLFLPSGEYNDDSSGIASLAYHAKAYYGTGLITYTNPTVKVDSTTETFGEQDFPLSEEESPMNEEVYEDLWPDPATLHSKAVSASDSVFMEHNDCASIKNITLTEPCTILETYQHEDESGISHGDCAELRSETKTLRNAPDSKMEFSELPLTYSECSSSTSWPQAGTKDSTTQQKELQDAQNRSEASKPPLSDPAKHTCGHAVLEKRDPEYVRPSIDSDNHHFKIVDPENHSQQNQSRDNVETVGWSTLTKDSAEQTGHPLG